MNYFSVRGLGLLGLQGVCVEVECFQSRRLPYLQVLGASASAAAEMRERVWAALESAGCRLPARRTTVRFSPGMQGFSLENLDLAVALAILAAGGTIPARRLEGVLVSGSLGLDGKIRPVGAELAAKRIFCANAGEWHGVLLPFSESSWLAEASLAHGGGFESLAEVVKFLREEKEGRKISPPLEAENAPAGPIELSEEEQRWLLVAAAGAHHTLVVGSDERSLSRKRGLARFLPVPEPLSSETSLRRHSVLLNSGLHPAEELLQAGNGVYWLQNLLKCEAKSLANTFDWMESGRLEWRRGGFFFSENLEALILAEIPDCDCGERRAGHCRCRPFDLQKFRQKVARLLTAPFDLRISPRESGKMAQFDRDTCREAVAAARQRMISRQGCLNSRLDRNEILRARDWEAGAMQAFRAIAGESSLDGRGELALARVALTISDLRGAKAIGEQDLLEARHYVVLG